MSVTATNRFPWV